jgi:hypothetical protein
MVELLKSEELDVAGKAAFAVPHPPTPPIDI